MNIDYIDLTEEQIAKLQSETPDALAAAGLIALHGARQGILDYEETLKLAHNLFIAIMDRDS